MTVTVRITEADIRNIIAEHFGINPLDVTLHHVASMQDGPHHSPATVRAEVEGVDPQRLIAAQSALESERAALKRALG